MISSDNDNQTFDNSQTSNLTFIDTNLTNYQSLIPDGNSSNVVLIDSGRDGIEQITQALEQYDNLDSISIFSHGDVGLIQLGNTYLSNANLDSYQGDLAAWGNALSAEGDLLLYGCNVGANEAGLDFVDQIADLTNADIAVSNDLTGNALLGGDWTLEVTNGTIETPTFVLNEYGSMLALSQQDILTGNTADFNGDGRADILRQEKGHWDDDHVATAQIFISTGNGFSKKNLAENLNIKGDKTNLYIGDFNGDGKSDILRQEKGTADDDNIKTASLLISTGNGFNNIALPETLQFSGDFNNLYIGDFNGDGKSDVFRQQKLVLDNNLTSLNGSLFISYGSGFINYTMPRSFNLQGDFTNLHVGDFNGDGKADLLRQEKNFFDNNKDNDAHLLISQGTSFQPSFQKIDLPGNFNWNGEYTNLYVGDFNGDGKDDIIRQEKSLWDRDRSNTANLLISTGTSFNKIDIPENRNLKGDYTNLLVGDFNGDGKDDFVRQEKNNWDGDAKDTAKIFLSTGSGFNPIGISEDFNLGGDYTNLYTGDYNGDGKTDLISQKKGWHSDASIGGSNSHLLLSTGNKFNQNSINSGVSFNGNFSNIITNNTITNYLANNTTNGLKFNFTYDDGVTFQQKKAFEFAGQMWSEFLRDNVTVNLHISMANSRDLPDNTVGGAVPFFHQNTSYKKFRKKLGNDIDNKALNYGNNDDTTALNSLHWGESFEALAPSNNGNGISRDFTKVAVTRANAKALHLIDSDDTALDGTIVMNDLVGTGVSWQYNYFSNNVGATKLDFTTVAMHEIGHTLGFVSVVDGLSNDNYQDYSVLNESITALDLFRYLEDSNSRSIRTTNSILSIDGGETSLGRTAYGTQNIGGDNGADGYQASHFKNEDNAGIMDPVLETNVRRQIGELDLRALDVIGWDRKFAANSWDILASDALNTAEDTGNTNRNGEVGQMAQDWRWARRGSRDRLRQEGNIAHFLAQEGFFNVGVFRESFDFSSVNPVIKKDFITVVDNHSLAPEFPTNNDLDVTNSSEIMSGIDIQDVVVESSGINYEEMVALVTEELSDHELSQLSLDDLAQLIEQQLAEPIVSALN